MNIKGWAFKENELELRDKNSARYKEIQHLVGNLNLKKSPQYGHTIFTGQLEGEAKSLSAFDVALIADNGNLCFGGECGIRSDGRFSGSYNTD